VSVPRPQGVVYAAASNELFVGSDEGKLYIYSGDALELITSIDLEMMSTTFVMTPQEACLRCLRRR